MNTPPPEPAPSATRERWERKARWILPLGCLGCVIVVGAVALYAISLIYGAIRSSDPYQLALAAANGDKRVAAVLGSPVTDRLFVSGSFNSSGPSGRAELALPVKGPKGQGTVFAMASKSVGVWNIEVAVLEVAGTRERIDLLQEPSQTTPAPSATPGA